MDTVAVMGKSVDTVVDIKVEITEVMAKFNPMAQLIKVMAKTDLKCFLWLLWPCLWLLLLQKILFVLLVDPLLFPLPFLLQLLQWPNLSQLPNLFNQPHLSGHLSHLPGLLSHLPGPLPHLPEPLPQHLPLLYFKRSLLYPPPPQPQ